MAIEKKWPTVKVTFGCDTAGCTRTGEASVPVGDDGRLSSVTITAPAGWSNPLGKPRLCPICAKGGVSLDGVG